MRAAALPLALATTLALGSCTLPWALSRRAAPGTGLGPEGREDPALSGDGRLLATLVERGGRTTVLLQDRRSGQVLPLRHLRGHQPHSSPSLSWNGRYLALIQQRGDRRVAVIEDRLQGRLLPLPMGGDREPRRLSLAPDAQRLAIEQIRQGRREVEVLDLSGWLEADLPPGQLLRGAGAGGPP